MRINQRVGQLAKEGWEVVGFTSENLTTFHFLMRKGASYRQLYFQIELEGDNSEDSIYCLKWEIDL